MYHAKGAAGGWGSASWNVTTRHPFQELQQKGCSLGQPTTNPNWRPCCIGGDVGADVTGLRLDHRQGSKGATAMSGLADMHKSTTYGDFP